GGRLESKSSYSLSSIAWARRDRSSMRKCRSHLGQTLKFSSRSFFQIIWRQVSHFTHRPSVRTLRSPEVSNSPDWRLNHAMESSYLLMVVGWWLTSPQSSVVSLQQK